MSFTRKEKIQMRNRVQEINVRIGEMADALEKDKRSLTKEEIEERDALVQEKEIIQLRMNQEGTPRAKEEMSQERAFAQTIASMHGDCDLPDETRSLVQGGKLEIPITRDVIQDTASASAVIPLTIGDIIQPLEKGLILDKIGAKMQYGLTGSWQFPIVAGVEATLADENVQINDTNIDISKINPEPKRVAISIPVSNRAIDQSNGTLLTIVKQQLPMAVARLINKIMFSQTKVSDKAPVGCFVEPKSKLTYATNISWKDAIALKGSVMKEGVIFDGSAAYVCSATTYADLESTPRDSGSGLMIIENGKINGFPVFITEYIGDDCLGFGIFSYHLVGQFGKMRMTYDPYTGAKKNLVYFVFNTDIDLLSLRNEAFGILSKKVAGK